VSELCLGTVTFGRETDERTSHDILDKFVASGGNFLDTGNAYYPPTPGASERIIGKWLKHQPRERIVVATKVFFPMGAGPNERGLSRKHILASVQGSLRRLQTDYVDLYLLHCWDHLTQLEESLRTLDYLVGSGQVRYVGVSNFAGWQLQKAIATSRSMGWAPIACLQAQYNLLCRSTEWELIPACREEGIALTCWSPLHGGWLSGKYDRDMQTAPQGSRAETAEREDWDEFWSNLANEHTWQLIDELKTLSREIDKTPAQVAIRWLLERPGVTAPIIGVRTPEQLQDNLGSLGWSLTAPAIERLNEASDLPLPYPYSYAAKVRKIYGR
jgi:aryl-alcohol dehydrogenase-like predicted oxidoreductase